MSERSNTVLRVWLSLGAWTLGALALYWVYWVLYADVPPQFRSLRYVLTSSVGLVGILLTFTSIVAGLRSHRLGRAQLAAVAFSVAALIYVTTGILSPWIDYQEVARRGVIDVEDRYPFGPRLPDVILEQRRYVLENPPAEYSYRADEPLAIAPNWLLYLFLSPIVVSLFALLNVLVGAVLVRVTTGLSPPVRRNVHLAVAIVGGGLLAASVGPIGVWVRGSPLRPASVIFLILLIPLVELAVLSALRRRDRRSSLHDSAPSGVL